jgi:hypothetical protein
MRENDHLEDLDVDGRVMIKWIFSGYNWGRRGLD